LLELDLTELPFVPNAGDPLTRLRARGRHQLGPILRALHEAGADHHVVGLIAKVGGALPWAAMQELRLGVDAFAASGKPTLAWAESFGEGSGDMSAYVLATGFDQIWLQPGGGLGLLGVGVETTFVRGALDHLGIEPQLEQRYEYKNAADRVMRTELTPAHRAALDRLADSIFTDAVATIATARGMDPARVRELADTGPRTAPQARDAGLVDFLGYRDQAYAAMRSRVDPDAELLFADRWHPRRRPHVPTRRKGHVALVEVQGTIVSGRTRRGPMGRQVGSDSVGSALRAATQDEHVRAVVLHVDSPGGSAVASDTIWREVCRVREAGKPVVVSMGQAAASGGYYISCPADVIVALPATLTGSIGVFGGKMVVSELLDRVGVTTGTVSYGAVSATTSASGSRQPSTPSTRASSPRWLGAAPGAWTRSRTLRGGGSGRAATRLTSGWSTSSVVCATPFASPVCGQVCRPMPRCGVQAKSLCSPGWDRRRTPRTPARRWVRRCGGSPIFLLGWGSQRPLF